MSSGSSSAPDNSRNEAQFSADQLSANPFSAKKSSPDLLRHVLEETLAAGSNAMTTEEWEKLQALARSPLMNGLDMLQVAEKLVTALLATRFPDLSNADANLRMCQRIASSLCGDPASMQRLKVFWNQLRASIS